MKWESERRIRRGCCYPEMEMKPSRVSKALEINPSSSTFSTPHSPFLPFGKDERKAVEAFKLRVEQKRAMAIELARRNTYC